MGVLAALRRHSRAVPAGAHQPVFPRARCRAPGASGDASCPSLPQDGLLCLSPASFTLVLDQLPGRTPEL